MPGTRIAGALGPTSSSVDAVESFLEAGLDVVREKGDEVTFAPEGKDGALELPTTCADLAAEVREGGRVLLDDVLIEPGGRAQG